jgi:hypothetical protein
MKKFQYFTLIGFRTLDPEPDESIPRHNQQMFTQISSQLSLLPKT